MITYQMAKHKKIIQSFAEYREKYEKITRFGAKRGKRGKRFYRYKDGEWKYLSYAAIRAEVLEVVEAVDRQSEPLVLSENFIKRMIRSLKVTLFSNELWDA